MISKGTELENVIDQEGKKLVWTINYLFYLFNNIIGAVSLPIQFLRQSLNFDNLKTWLYFLVNLVFHVEIRFIVVLSLISLCVYKRFYDFSTCDTNSFNQALTFNKSSLVGNVFFEFIQDEHV